MEIDKKIDEAKYFLKRMKYYQKQPETFQYNLSAFLSSSRSALQYVLEEVKLHKGGQKWYDEKMSKSPLLRYFKDKRDTNIHTESVKTRKDVQIVLHETVSVSESISIEKRDLLGNLLGKFNTKFNPSTIPKAKPPRTYHKYRFYDWQGNEDVLTLSKGCLSELNEIVVEARKLQLIV